MMASPSERSRIVVLGCSFLVIGFRLTGVEGFIAEDLATADRIFSYLIADPTVAIILIDDHIMDILESRVAEFRDTGRTFPVLTPLPEANMPLAR